MKTSTRFKPLLFIAPLMLSFMAAGYAQEARKLTLEEAIQLSTENSNHLKLSHAKVMEATALLREAKERMLPDLSISGAYLRLNKPTVDLKVNLGGSSSESNGSDNGTNTGSGSSSAIEVNQAMYGIASLSLPLFSGLRIQHGIESARYLEKAAKLDAEKNRQEIIENTIAAYSNLYKAKAALDIVKESLKQSEQRVADFSNLEKNGLLARNDLLKAQLQQSNIELSLLDAENNWKITYINMNLMLGLDESIILLPDTSSFIPVTNAGNFEEWEARALENRKDIAALAWRSKAANAGIKAAKGEYYPSVALTGGYIAADVPNVLTITNAINAGVGLKYSPSSLWKAGSKVAEAKAKWQQAETSKDILSDNVRLQTAQAYQSLLSNNKKIEVYAKAEEQASENYRIVKNKYDNSLATTTDLLEADVAQLQAKLNQVFSKADAVVAYNRLLLAVGMLNGNEPH